MQPEALSLMQHAGRCACSHVHTSFPPTRSLTPVQDFRCRFRSFLASSFSTYPPALALQILAPQLTFEDAPPANGAHVHAASGSVPGSAAGVAGGLRRNDGSSWTPHDLKRL